MAVTVTNKVDNGQPYRVMLVPVRRGEPRLVLPYNPESWTEQHSQRWVARDTAGVSKPKSDWEGNDPVHVRWRLLLSRREVGRAVEPEQVFNQLKTWAEEVDAATGEPPILFLKFGIHSYPVVLENLDVTRLRTDVSGAAYQGEIDVTFRINDKLG